MTRNGPQSAGGNGATGREAHDRVRDGASRPARTSAATEEAESPAVDDESKSDGARPETDTSFVPAAGVEEARTVQPDATPPQAEGTDTRTLEMLVCPLTKTTLEYDAAARELISRRANLAYPIRSGVPLLTREAARPLKG